MLTVSDCPLTAGLEMESVSMTRSTASILISCVNYSAMTFEKLYFINQR
jgi:hypothetical protein